MASGYTWPGRYSSNSDNTPWSIYKGKSHQRQTLRRSRSLPATFAHPSPKQYIRCVSASTHCFLRQPEQSHPSCTVQRQKSPSPGRKLYDVEVEGGFVKLRLLCGLPTAQQSVQRWRVRVRQALVFCANDSYSSVVSGRYSADRGTKQ